MRRLFLITLLGLATCVPNSAASSVTVEVRNEQGIPQAAEVVVGGPYLVQTPTDPFGRAVIEVEPGDVVSASRSFYDQCGAGSEYDSSPEGIRGEAYSVTYTGQTLLTITLPTVTQHSTDPAISQAESWLVARVNQLRAERALAPLAIYDVLSRAADNFAAFLTVAPTFSHCALWSVSARVADVGWPLSLEGAMEVIAMTGRLSDARTALDVWLNSPDHFNALMNSKGSNAIGIGNVGRYWVINLTEDRCATLPCGKYLGQGELSDLPELVVPTIPSPPPGGRREPAAGGPISASIDITVSAANKRLSGEIDSDYAGPATVYARSGGVELWRRTITIPSKLGRQAVPFGTMEICVETPATEVFGAGSFCKSVTVKPDASLLVNARIKGRRLVLRAAAPLRGRTVRVSFVEAVCRTRFDCRERITRRSVRIGARTRVVVPGGTDAVRVKTPRFKAQGVSWPSTSQSP